MNDSMAHGDKATGGEGPVSGEPGEQLPSWFLRQKISVPDRVAGHLDRTKLVQRAMPTRQRLTVLRAPAGFGKTTLLAECCRRLCQDGIANAWVSLDAHDEPTVLATYITVACRRAGLNIEDATDTGILGSGSESRVGHLVQAVESFEGQFVLALDELEQLGNRESLGLLEFLLQRGPPNLHIAIACRELPDGLNIAGAVLDGRAEVLTANELRFSKSEISEFFDLRLSRNELAALAAESAGWPIALRISRNKTSSGTPTGARAVQDFADNWVESRLWDGLAAHDREFLLDIGLFEWMDAELLEEVLERKDSMLRIETMPDLVGLLEPVRGDAVNTWRLHPLVRDHCVKRRFRDTPERFRAIHRRIARALMQRGETVAAMRHAAEAEESTLAADIFENAGGVRMWMQEGFLQLQAADRMLNEETVSRRPRLGLARCVVLVMTGRLAAARQRYRSVAAMLRDRAGDEGKTDFDLWADDCIVRGAIALYGCEPIGSDWCRNALADLAKLAEAPRIHSLTRGNLEFGLCVAHQMTADFDSALMRAARARRCFGARRYMSVWVDLQVGQVAMAQGRVQDAIEHYLRARRATKVTLVLETVRTVLAKVLSQELSIECNQFASAAELTHVPRALTASGTPFSAYAAASGVVAETRIRNEGIESALTAVETMLDYVCSAELPTLVRYLAAMRIGLLASARRVGDAERTWRLEALPEDPEGCLDLVGQSWREMEALSCARLRLLIESERFDAARGFAGDVRAVAGARGLRRTLMRTISLSIVLERRTGRSEAAAAHLLEYLRLLDETPYTRPLVREGEACAPVVAEYLDTAPATPCRESAQSLLAAIRSVEDPKGLVLSERETDILQRLFERQGDKQIAAALGLTAHGVRYHLRNLFTKLGAGSRAEAVRRANELGLILGGR